MQHIVDQLKSEGYAIIRGFLSPTETQAVSAEADRMYAEGLKHHATYRDKNLLFEVLNDPKAQRRVVLQAHWTAWISPVMEEMRRSEGYYAVLEPFLGPDIKQITHQLHWKPPGAKYTSYRFHQDARFRRGSIKAIRHLLESSVDHRSRHRPAERGERCAAHLSQEPPARLPRVVGRRAHHGRTNPGRGIAARGARSRGHDHLRDGARRSSALDALHRARLGAQCQRLRPAFHDQQLRPRQPTAIGANGHSEAVRRHLWARSRRSASTNSFASAPVRST